MNKKNKINIVAVIFLISSCCFLPTINADKTPACSDDIITNWYLLSLVLYNDDGKYQVDIHLLRDEQWIIETGAEVGGCIWLVIDEMGINDIVFVESIEPAPFVLAEGMVSGIFISNSSSVLFITFSTISEEIFCTSGHSLFVVEEEAWVQAKDIKPGDMIQTYNGAVEISSVQPYPGSYPVYNLEIFSDDHAYYVGTLDILAHNTQVTTPCNDLFTIKGPFLLDQTAFLTLDKTRYHKTFKQPIKFAESRKGQLSIINRAAPVDESYISDASRRGAVVKHQWDTISKFRIKILDNPDPRFTEVIAKKLHMPPQRSSRRLDAEVLVTAMNNNLYLLTEDINVLRNALELKHYKTYYVMWTPHPIKALDDSFSLHNFFRRLEFIIHKHAPDHHPNEFLGSFRPQGFESEFFK